MVRETRARSERTRANAMTTMKADYRSYHGGVRQSRQKKVINRRTSKRFAFNLALDLRRDVCTKSFLVCKKFIWL